jgi:hypothetical protein
MYHQTILVHGLLIRLRSDSPQRTISKGICRDQHASELCRGRIVRKSGGLCYCHEHIGHIARSWPHYSQAAGCWLLAGGQSSTQSGHCLTSAYGLGMNPKPWRLTQVFMIQKPGRKEPTNRRSYRPVALISCPGRGLEGDGRKDDMGCTEEG